MSTPEQMTNCPGEETLAAFTDGRLDGPARRRVIEHMAVCGDCRAVFLEAFEINGLDLAERTVPSIPASTRRIPVGWAALAAGVLVALLLLPQIRERLQVRSGIGALAVASETLRYRKTDARLSGPFQYRPLRPVKRGPEPADIRELRLLATAAEVQERAHQKPTDRNLHAYGASLILLGRFDEAIKALDEARARQVRDGADADERGAVLNDLAVAHHERGTRRDQMDDVRRAAELSEQSWELSKTPAAAWTRAVAYDRLGLLPAARAAWRDYLNIEPASAWSAEARERMKEGESPSGAWERERNRLLATDGKSTTTASAIVRRFPQQARTLGENELLAAWARESLERRPGPAWKQLEKASLIGEALIAANGESLLRDSVREIKAARSDPERAALLLEGHVAYANGLAAYRRLNIAEANRLLAEAEQKLSRAETPFAALASIYKASALFYGNEYLKVVPAAEPARAACATTHYAACGLQGWIAGLGLTEIGQYMPAAAVLLQARTSFIAIGETSNAAAVGQLRAEALAYLSADEDAWTERYAAMRLSGKDVSSRPVIWIDAAKASLNDHSPRVARRILTLIAESALGRKDYMHAADAVTWRILANSNRKAAEADRQLALALVGKISDPAVRERAAANLELVAVTAAADRTDASTGRGLAFYASSGHSFATIEMLAQRSRARRARGELGKAMQDLDTAIEVLEKERAFVRDSFALSLFNERRRTLILSAARIAGEQGRAADSLAYCNRARDLDLQIKNPAALVSKNWNEGRQLLRDIPARVVIVQQELLSDRLATWVVRRGSVAFRESQIDRRKIDDLIAKHADAIRYDIASAEITDTARQLHDALLGRVIAGIRSDELFVYSPGRELRGVAVAALVGDRGPLIKTRSIAIARSASSISWDFRSSPGGEASLLVLSGSVPSGMSALASARREVADVVALYPRHLELNADQPGTKAAFLARVRDFDVIHVVGHGVTAELPLRNSIAFRDERLHVYEILQLSLQRAPTVVLSACDTASEQREAGLSLTAAFHAAGAGVVIGSLFAVEDEATRRLIVDFHAARRMGIPPVEALRRAQLAAAAKGAPAAVWAGFQVLL